MVYEELYWFVLRMSSTSRQAPVEIVAHGGGCRFVAFSQSSEGQNYGISIVA